MIVYGYDDITKEYIGANVAYLDKVATKRTGRDIYAIPMFTTTTEPPIAEDGKVAIFNEELKAWELQDDFRGQLVYNLKTREGQVWDKVGKLPRGYSLKLPEKLDEEIVNYLNTMKANFNTYMANTKIGIPGFDLYFTYDSLERLQNEQTTGITMSRDDNNKIYMLTRQEYDVIIDYLVTYGQYMYIRKWQVENTIKKCGSLDILKTYKLDLEFKADINVINNIVKLTPDKRKEYFTRLANNIK